MTTPPHHSHGQEGETLARQEEGEGRNRFLATCHSVAIFAQLKQFQSKKSSRPDVGTPGSVQVTIFYNNYVFNDREVCSVACRRELLDLLETVSFRYAGGVSFHSLPPLAS